MMLVVSESERSAEEREVEVLARIGQYLFHQDLRVSVRLPAALADDALAAWQREDSTGALEPETQARRASRHQAGDLALIGLALKERASLESDQVQVELDAWQIGSALNAADQRGLLAGVKPPGPNA